ncbi:MAG TPA: condensation domain-containing protein, partial [Myxococcota bacterium]|nr:condensation domain-containing protein [Myxococcota bacterium]
GALPLSFAQQRLWFLDQLEPGSAAYNMPLAVRLKGLLRVEALEAAFQEVIRRHESLRTRFPAVAGEPVQVAFAPSGRRLPVVDLAGLPEVSREEEARQLAHREASRPFDLERGPVLRTTLLRLGDREHLLLTTLHHIASDGWSMEVLIRELGTLYVAARRGEPSPLPELPVQYGDFAVWQRKWLSGDVLEAELAHWRSRLGEDEEVLELPTDQPRPAVRRHRGASRGFTLPERLAAGLQALAHRERVTPFMVLLAGFQALLFRSTGQPGIRVGTPVAGRTRLETEGLIGFFVNTLVLRAELSREMSTGQLLGRVREAALDAWVHQELPFEKLVEELQPARHLSRTPLFQVSFVFQASVFTASLPELSELRIESLEESTGTAKFDLSLSMELRGEALRG